MPEQPLEILGKKKSGNIITSIGTSATLTSLGATAGAVMAIMTFLSYMHIDVIPFAWASDVESIEKSIDKLTEVITNQNKTVLEIQRDSYVRQLHEAEEELDRNPESRAAKKEVDRLKQVISDLNKQIETLSK
jgi:hypothetical protein